VCNRLLAICTKNEDLIPKYDTLDKLFDSIFEFYDVNKKDIEDIVNDILNKTPYSKISCNKYRLFTCYSIMYHLTLIDIDRNAKMQIFTQIKSIIRSHNLLNDLIPYIDIKITNVIDNNEFDNDNILISHNFIWLTVGIFIGSFATLKLFPFCYIFK